MSTPRHIASLASGLLFGLGLAISGMTRPLKVLGFLDVTGQWDASLLFVLGGAAGVATVAFHSILRRRAPINGGSFEIPTSRAIDRRLLLGAAIFGLGWGSVGYCPGPAIAMLAHPNIEALYFLPALIAGWWLYRFLEPALEPKGTDRDG